MITFSTGSDINGDDDDVPDVEFFKPTLEYMGISWVGKIIFLFLDIFSDFAHLLAIRNSRISDKQSGSNQHP